MREALPSGWARVPLGYIARCDWGNTSLTKAAYRDQGVTAFSATGPDGLVADAEHNGQGIVLSAIGANCGKCFFADGHWTAIKNTITIVPSTELAVPQFMFFQLNRRELWPKRGGGQPFIGLGDTRELAVSLPPLNEQRRIVAKLEALQSRSRAAREALDAVPPLLEKLRQSILAAAFRGDLTKEWREKHPDVEPASALLKRIRVERRKKWEEAELAKMKAKGKPPRDERWKAKYKEPAPVDTTGLPELPRGWCWISVGELLAGIEAGASFKCDERPPAPGETGVAKVSAVTWGEYDDDESKTCLDPARINDELLVRPGDFLFSRANTIDLVGACVIANRTTKRVMLSDKILRFEVVQGWQEYLLHALRSPWGRREIERLSTGNQLSMRNIGQDRIRQIALPLPSLEEATFIASAVAEADNARRRVLEMIRESNVQVSGLDRAILAKTFRGELVPQDRNDEPAAVMLERVRADGGQTRPARINQPKRGRRGPQRRARK